MTIAKPHGAAMLEVRDTQLSLHTYLLIHCTDYFKQLCCVPESDVVAVEPQARLDAMAGRPQGGPRHRVNAAFFLWDQKCNPHCMVEPGNLLLGDGHVK